MEKPSYAEALEYIRKGYVWNGGVFAFAPATMAELFRRHLPSHHEALERLLAGASLEEVYAGLPKISIDYGVMEKAERVRVVLGRFPWDDVGNWRALERVFSQDPHENVVLGEGRHVALDTFGCVVYADRGVVATLGVSGLVVAKVGDEVLVVPKDWAREVREVVKRPEAQE